MAFKTQLIIGERCDKCSETSTEQRPVIEMRAGTRGAGLHCIFIHADCFNKVAANLQKRAERAAKQRETEKRGA